MGQPSEKAGAIPSTTGAPVTGGARFRDHDSLRSALRDAVRIVLHPIVGRLPLRDGRTGSG